jgi:hypothetical protein
VCVIFWFGYWLGFGLLQIDRYYQYAHYAQRGLQHGTTDTLGVLQELIRRVAQQTRSEIGETGKTKKISLLKKTSPLQHLFWFGFSAHKINTDFQRTNGRIPRQGRAREKLLLARIGHDGWARETTLQYATVSATVSASIGTCTCLLLSANRSPVCLGTQTKRSIFRHVRSTEGEMHPKSEAQYHSGSTSANEHDWMTSWLVAWPIRASQE